MRKKSKCGEHVISVLKIVLRFLPIFGLCSGSAFAEDVTDISSLVNHITDSFQSIGMLMVAIAYIAGFAMVIASLFKFKQHKDNPTQIPMGAAIALMAVGIVLIFLPGIIEPAGETLFGTGVDQWAGGYKGGGASSLPGASQ